MNLSRMYWMPLRLQGIRLSVKAESQWIAFQDVMYCSESEGRTGNFFNIFQTISMLRRNRKIIVCKRPFL